MRLIDADSIPWEVDGVGEIPVITKEEIDDMPTVDAVPVRHGHWVGIDDEPCETFECDVCGFVLDDWIQGAFYRFCPNCGARMYERKEE